MFGKALEMRRNLDRNSGDLSQKYPDVQATADMFPGGEFPEILEHQVTLTLTLLSAKPYPNPTPNPNPNPNPNPEQDWRVCWRGGGFNNDSLTLSLSLSPP